MLGVINGIKEAMAGADGNNPRNPKKLQIFSEKAAVKLPHLLNPNDMKITRTVTWSPSSGADAEGNTGSPYMTFGGGSDKLTFTVTLDCSEEKEVDLKDELEALYDLSYPYTTMEGSQNKEAKRAQLVTIKWNKFTFSGVAESVDITTTLFDFEGRFKRATVLLSLKGFAFDKGEGVDKKKFFEEARVKTAVKSSDIPDAKSASPLAGMKM